MSESPCKTGGPATINGKPFDLNKSFTLGPKQATGHKTPQGKAVSARNPTTHGLFTRDVVLPSLGEDPKGYSDLQMELCLQLEPNGLIERHYVEKIAAASWRLRRLHRWQAQVWEDEALTEDERLDKLDRVMRHETALQRQIDTSIKMLSRDVPLLLEGRARKLALEDLFTTERDCRFDLGAESAVASRAREHLRCMPLCVKFNEGAMDNTNADTTNPVADPAPPPSPVPAETQIRNCQNELPPPPVSPAPLPAPPPAPSLTPPLLRAGGTVTQNCQNELPLPSHAGGSDIRIGLERCPAQESAQPVANKEP